MTENTQVVKQEDTGLTIQYTNTLCPDRLKEMLEEALKRMASQRTTKYFLGDKEYNERLVDVAETIKAIRATRSMTITVDNEAYSVSEYKIPSKLVDYVNSGRIYATAEAVGRREPILKAVSGGCKLTPVQFNRFFESYNENNKDHEISCVESWSRTDHTLAYVQYGEDKYGMMVKLRDEGFDLETCYLMGFQVDGSAVDCFTKVSKPSVDGLTTWLFS